MIWAAVKSYLPIVALIACLAAFSGGYVTGSGHKAREWALERAQSDLAAKTAQAEANERHRSTEALQAQQTRDMEEAYANRIKNADAGRDAFAKRLRDAQKGLAGCQLPPTPADPGGAQDITPGGSPGLRSTDFGRTQRLREVGVRLQGIVRLCHEWAGANGR